MVIFFFLGGGGSWNVPVNIEIKNIFSLFAFAFREFAISQSYSAQSPALQPAHALV